MYGINDNKMDLIHCQKDYIDGTITVHYEGEYNKEKTIEYVKKSYGDVVGEIIEIQEPTESKGFKNVGVVLLR